MIFYDEIGYDLIFEYQEGNVQCPMSIVYCLLSIVLLLLLSRFCK
jgi:hypothetical protein